MAQREAAAQKAAEERTEGAPPPDGESGSESEAEKKPEEKPSYDPFNYDPDNDPDAIQLNYPLIQIYLKNGNNVLAMLPMVPGLQEMEVAELRDDRTRLESEAFVKGFQGQILDIIGLRNLLAARIQLQIKDKKIDEAERTLSELRGLPSFTQMADELDQIQRQMLEVKGASISEKRSIDRMFQTTRDLLQKYLQDNLIDESSDALKKAGGSTVGANVGA